MKSKEFKGILNSNKQSKFKQGALDVLAPVRLADQLVKAIKVPRRTA